MAGTARSLQRVTLDACPQLGPQGQPPRVLPRRRILGTQLAGDSGAPAPRELCTTAEVSPSVRPCGGAQIAPSPGDPRHLKAGKRGKSCTSVPVWPARHSLEADPRAVKSVLICLGAGGCESPAWKNPHFSPPRPVSTPRDRSHMQLPSTSMGPTRLCSGTGRRVGVDSAEASASSVVSAAVVEIFLSGCGRALAPAPSVPLPKRTAALPSPLSAHRYRPGRWSRR